MSAERLRTPAVRLAVVGHTNTGKTSLMRTLTRDSEFGEVSSRPSTTRHVEGARLVADGETLVELFDTPGMEDPIALLEVIETDMVDDTGERLDGPARVERFLASPMARGRLEQEAKVLRQMLASDGALYVVDARDPVLAKHRDELALLGACAVPLLPVLNFVSSGDANESAWREALARLGLHAVVRFDTVAPERGAERMLFDKLATLLDTWRPALDKLVACREREAQARLVAGRRLVAEMLVDVAACRQYVADTDERGLASKLADLNRRVREREQVCVDALLALFHFRPDAVDADALPLADGRWEADLFQPETLRNMGVKLSSGVAAGAAAGFGVDALFGGLTLGAGTAIGALAGGGVQAFRHFGRRIKGVVTGERELSVDDGILRLLILRELHLLEALDRRGHAAVRPIEQFAADEKQWREGKLPESLLVARAHESWSSLCGGAGFDIERERAIDRLAEAFAGKTSTEAAHHPHP